MEKSLVLSVSVRPGCYRHIQISENATLYDLHKEIMYSFDFDDDHMHVFFMNNRAWDRNAEYICPGGSLGYEKNTSDKVKLSNFHLKKGDKFLYIFDFGDEWRFQIKVLQVIDGLTKTPVVIKSVGMVNQYRCDEDDNEEY